MGKIVFVHGIGDAGQDYWHEWRDKVVDAIGKSKFDPGNDCYGVWWEGVMEGDATKGKTGTRSLKAVSLTSEASKLKDEINTNIHRELIRWCRSNGKSIDRSAERGFMKDYLGDFIFYRLNPDLADRVQSKLREKLTELSQNDSELHIICHSWGTVVA